MASNDITTTIVVDAKDKTGAAFNQIETGLNRVKGANENMATSVFKGVAAWDLLKKGLGMATDFLKSSIEASATAQREMAMVQKNVENAGFAYDSIKGKLGEYSKSMIQMGFDDEETATSVSRLMLVTKDYEKSLTLNNLAADIARNKGIGLEEASKAVTMALAGNLKMLKQYVPDLDASTSSADALAAVQDKLKGSMETFAATTEGKMAIMKVTWGNFKEQVGDIFGPALNIALTNFNSFLTKADQNAGVASESISKKLQRSLATLVNPDAWKLLGKTVATDIKEASWFVTENTFGRLNSLLSGEKYTKSQSPWEQNQQSIIDLETEIEKTEQAAMNLQNAVIETTPDFTGLGKAGTDAGKKTADAMKTVLDKLKDYKQSINDIKKAQEDEATSFIKGQIEKRQSFDQQLADMIKSHKDKWNEANKARQDLEAKADKTQEDYDRLMNLKAETEKEFAIIQPYLNNAEMSKLSETSDVDRLINAFRSGQAEETVASGEAQAKLVEKAQNITINFDLTNSTITDKNFIQMVKDELNKSLNLIRSTN